MSFGKAFPSFVVGLLILTACGDNGSTSAPSSVTETTLPTPPSNDPIVVKPPTVEPGELVELTFPTEIARGAPWVLSRWTGTEWTEPLYLVIASQRSGYNADGPDWRPKSEEWGWDDVGFGGPGPDIVVVPDTAEAGTYRFCTANTGDRSYCAQVRVSTAGP